MKYILFICLLFFSSLLSYAQKINYSINLDFHLPYIAPSEKNYETYPSSTGYITTPGIKENYSENLGGKLGGQMQLNITNNLSISTGLRFNLIRFKRNDKMINPTLNLSDRTFLVDSSFINIYSPDTSGLIITPVVSYTFDQDKDLGKSSILYTEIPIHINYAFLNQKLFVKIGINVAFLTYSEIYKYSVDESYFFSMPTVEKDKSSDGLTNLMWSGNIGIEYVVYKNIGLNLNYSRSFNSIYDEDASVGKPKYNIFSVGLSYHFIKKL